MNFQNPNLDFQVVPTYDPRLIVVYDNSSWGMILEKPSIMEVTIPGYSNTVVHYFEKNRVNTFNSVNLRMNCPSGDCDENTELIQLPDGIYKFKLIGSPDTYNISKYYLKTSGLQLELDSLYILKATDESYFTKIQKIEYTIKYAEAALRLGNIALSSVLYKKAKEEVDNLKESCSN